MNWLEGYGISQIIMVFLFSGAVVWIAGTRLAFLGDELAERLNLTREFIGLIFLATVTELPEIVTTLTAARAGNAELVLGNMFGGITMQTAILAIADIFVVRYALTSWPRKPNHALVAVMLVFLLSALLASTFIGDRTLVGGVGIAAICLAMGFPLTVALHRYFDQRTSWVPIDLPDLELDDPKAKREPGKRRELSTGKLIAEIVLFSLLVLAGGIVLATSADALSEQTGLGASFVGVALLAAATSLPELSTTIAAARIGAYTMAIANIFGSNLIMLALILPADLAYTGGAILNEATDAARFSIATGIMVTSVYIGGILIRRTPRMFGAGLDSWLVLAIYIGSLFALYQMR